MKDPQTTPPQWFNWLLSLICKKDILEILQGDLFELYSRNFEAYGRRKANLLYFKDVLTTLRPTLMSKLEGNHSLNRFGMFKNHVRTSVRNLKHNPLFSAINIMGLAISMSVGIMMIIFLTELYSVDDFHKQKDNIYRVTTTQPGLMGDQIDHLATSSYFLADRLAEQFPEVENVAVMSWQFKADIKTATRQAALSGFYATPPFFKLLSFQLNQGNPNTALTNPESVILTTTAAKKLFPNDNPMGQQVAVDGLGGIKTGMVTGIIADPPANSYLNFDIIIPMARNPMINPEFRNNPNNTFENYVYLLLNDQADVPDIETRIARILSEHPSDMSSVKHSLEPMGSFVTGASMNANGPSFSNKKVKMMIGLTVIVLLSACFNYTNLSLGRSLRRLKEISVRKVVGANKHQLFSQFIVEAVLISFVALLLGIGLFLLARPFLLDQVNHVLNDRPFFTLKLSFVQLGHIILFALFIGVIAGVFPAWVLSRLKPNLPLNDAGKVKLRYGMNTRKTLTTFQFSLSIGLIMCSLIVYEQYNFVVNFDLGYKTENIINIAVKGDYMELLEQEYTTLPQVRATAKSQSVLGLHGGQFGNVISSNFEDTTMYSYNHVGANYFEMHEFDWLAGTSFTNPFDPNEIIVNEQIIKALNIASPTEAIGQKVRLRDEDGTIVTIHGVVQDFRGVSLDFQMPEPFIFFPMHSGQTGTLGLKIVTEDLLGMIKQLESSYQKHDPVHPFVAQFYDEQLSSNYQQLKSSFTIISFLAIIAISISSLGLIGIAVYTIESRMKEISIRKVLGASTKNLIKLLSTGFSIMIVIATIIAIPLALHVVDEMLLQSFFHRIDIGFLEMASGFIIAILIAALAVGSQVRRVTIQKPVDLLRDE